MSCPKAPYAHGKQWLVPWQSDCTPKGFCDQYVEVGPMVVKGHCVCPWGKERCLFRNFS